MILTYCYFPNFPPRSEAMMMIVSKTLKFLHVTEASPSFSSYLSVTHFSWNEEEVMGERNGPKVGPASVPTSDSLTSTV